MCSIPATAGKRGKKYLTGMSHAYVIINYSNATPFKTDNGIFRCLYGCVSENDLSPETFREHNRSEHVQNRLAVVTGQPDSVIKIDVKDLVCIICNLSVSSLEALEDHLKTTHNIKFQRSYRDIIVPFELTAGAYQCQMCENTFPDLRQVNRHMHVHFSYHTCALCGAGFMTKQHLRWHKEVHKKDGHPCIVCGKTYDSLAKRRRHVETIHNGATVHGCPMCPERFKEYYLKAKHLAEVHKALPDSFPCALCDKTFTTKTNLNLHQRRNHQNERNHKCTYCDKTFFLSARLKDHLSTHTGEKSFICDICEKAYGTRRSLTKHYKTHKDVPKLEEPLCLPDDSEELSLLEQSMDVVFEEGDTSIVLNS